MNHWREHEMQMYLAIPRLVSRETSKLSAPEALQQHTIATFRALPKRSDLVPHCNAFLEAMDCMNLTPVTLKELVELLAGLIQQHLIPSSEDDPKTLLSMGTGLKAYSQYEQFTSIKPDIWPRVYDLADRFGTLPSYLEAVLISLRVNNDLGSTGDLESLADVLIGNLHSSSHILRKLSLEIIGILKARSHPQQADVVITALTIEDSPIDLQSARSLSMHVRKLSPHIETVKSSEGLQRAVAHFCFGLLTFKLSQLWTDAVDVLKEICRSKAGEEIVSGLAFHFLEEVPITGEISGVAGHEPTPIKSLNNFECSNLIAVESGMDGNLVHMKDASQLAESHFYTTHQPVTRTPPGAPSLALRVLQGVPHVAEKHSRQLVPIFLRWAAEDKEDTQLVSADAGDTAYEPDEALSPQVLARKERKMMLDLFGCFTNPKVLHRSTEVFEALKNLLASGDIDVQKSALKALLRWKIPGLEPYQENLTNLLDDASFREEISVFVNVDGRDSTIKDEHRQDLMPVLLRLLFGKVIARCGSSSRRGQVIKRKAVLGAMSRFDPGDLREFVAIALGPLAAKRLVNETQLDESLLQKEILGVRKQVGLVNMVKDMLDTLGSQLAPLAENLIEALLYCTVRAARLLSSASHEASIDDPQNHQVSLLKDVRQIGLQCLTLIFEHRSAQEMQPYIPAIYKELVTPRLEKLPVETAQSVSGVLRLLATWASGPETVLFLSDYNHNVLRSVVDCLDVPSAKPDVKLFVLDNIIKKIVRLAERPIDVEDHHVHYSVKVLQRVLSPHMEYILRHVGKLIRTSPGRDILESSIELVSMLAPLVEGSTVTIDVLEISAFLLEQPSHRVKPKSKGDLLRIIQHFIPLSSFQSIEVLQNRLFCIVSSLFGYFKDRVNRQILCKVLHTLADRDPELREITDLCASLNSFSAQKIDEPDFEKRLAAFNAINETKFKIFTPKQWRPLIYNMLFYVRDDDELAIRSNAAFALRRFVESNTFAMAKSSDTAFSMLESVLLPALRNGASEPSELVRSEYLNIMAHVVRHNPDWEQTNDMRVLLVDEDEEASFFGNILHIQHHRRLRALRRLAGEARKGVLRPANVAHFFIPLVEHFVFDRADDESAHNLSAEAIATISALALSLEWPQFRAMLRRYTGYIQSKPDLDKTVIKLVGRTIDALSEATSNRGAQAASVQKIILSGTEPAEIIYSTLASTIPRQEKLTDDILINLLPSLRQFLHEKDESTVSLRVPVAVSIVKLLKLLPPAILKDHLPSLLTDVCNILRSRAQESRDLTRKTLVDISALIGPSCFGFVLKELRSSLAKGYQLHVLSFTVHAILVATAEIFKPGELDYCLSQIISVIMDDIFGATGQEKDAEEYISKMREVKSSKSFDSMELVAKTTSVDSFVNLLKPLQNLLQEKLDSRMVRKVDELLRRIGVGLLRNHAINDRRVLMFCHEILREAYKTGSVSHNRDSTEDHRTKRFLISMKGAGKNDTRGSTSSYGFKLARFSFDVLRSVLHKYDALQTPANLSGFIPIIGDSLVQSNEEIQISALRLLTTIIKVPLKEIDENGGIYIAESVRIIKGSTSTNTEHAQAALKLVSAVLRERRCIEIRETDLAYLLKRLIPDMEEPDRQGVVFGFLKAVLARKVVITEVYEVIDTVATIMVTNQTKGARDLARSVYFQFIMDYPQGKSRFAKQLSFLAHNLDYKHQEGRQSVMEAIHLLLSKVGQGLVEEVAGTFFVPLVMVVVNDESVECREMGSALIKTIFEKVDAERRQPFMALLRSWLDQPEQPLLVRASLQVYGIYLDSAGGKIEKEVPRLLSSLGHLLKTSLRDGSATAWEILYISLQTFSKVCQTSPAHAFAASSAPSWASVRQCLRFPHAWVKLSAAKLLGIYFGDFARCNDDEAQKKLPRKGSGGLLFNSEEMVEITKASLRLLGAPGVGEELAAQSVRNLVFLSKAMGELALSSSPADTKTSAEVDEVDDDDVENDDLVRDPNEISSRTTLQFMFERASAIVRHGPARPTASALTPMKAALQLIGALCNHLGADALMPSLQTILLPLHNLTDPSIPAPFSADEAFSTTYKALVSNSTEVLSLLQNKLGTTEYVSNLSKVRSLVKERREGRRVKRRIEAVAEPEKVGKLKQRKGEKKREKRKERSGVERGRRRGW